MEFFTFLVVYGSVAWLLFKMPNLFHCPVAANELHKKHFLIISHRGGSGEHPENTLKAFKSTAWADVLELDVVFSADKQIVVSHDDCIERLCGKKEFISKMKFQDLPKYKKEFFSHFLEENFRSDESGRFCLLEDVFKECPDSIICVDLKTPSDEAIQVMAKLIEKYNRSKLTIFGTNDFKANKKIKELGIGTMKFMTMGKIIFIYLAYLLGFITLISINEDIIALPIMTETFKKLKIEEMGKFRAMIYTLIVQFFFFVAGPLNKYLAKRGVSVFYWTLNHEFEVDLAISVIDNKRNCAGIITDYPTKMRNYLSNSKIN